MKVPAYHTDSTEYPPQHRTVYHDHDDCPTGRQIKREHRREGKGNKDRCLDCTRLGD